MYNGKLIYLLNINFYIIYFQNIYKLKSLFLYQKTIDKSWIATKTGDVLYISYIINVIIYLYVLYFYINQILLKLIFGQAYIHDKLDLIALKVIKFALFENANNYQ